MSWEKVKMGDFLTAREIRFKPTDNSISELRRIDKIDFSGKIFISDKPSNTDMILIKKGDLVISGINVEKGAMAVYTGEEDLLATIHYSSYSFDENKIDIDFLKFFLKSLEFKNALKEQVPGGIKTEIKPKHILPLVVEIPTEINEQREVVKSLQNLNYRVDSITTELNHQRDLVKKLKQQLLNDAIQGKLVSQNETDEPASALLARIKIEKAHSGKKEKPLAPITDAEIPFEIPDNWVWCRLGEIALYSEAGISFLAQSVSAKKNQVGVIKTSAITSGCFLEEESKLLLNLDFNLDKIKIYKDDFLFCRASGSRGLAGKSCLVMKQPDATLVLSDKSIRYVIYKEISKNFIQFYNTSFFGENYFEGLGIAKSTTMNNINREQFNYFPIPLPPLAEQQRIVEKLDNLMAMCNFLETHIANSAALNAQLLQQVLREALRN